MADAGALEEQVYTAEPTTAPAEDDDGFEYTTVPVADVPPSVLTETLHDTLQEVQIAQKTSPIVEPDGSIDHPELVQDFIRNYLISKGLNKTFHAFQTEWYDMVQSGRIDVESAETVPDCYVENSRLSDEVSRLTKELDRRQRDADKATAVAESLRKERDFHRISHRRVKEEKRALQATTAKAEATAAELTQSLSTMRGKYERTLRQKTTTTISLERSRQEVDEMVELSKTVLDLSKASTATNSSAIGGNSTDVGAAAAGPANMSTQELPSHALPEPGMPTASSTSIESTDIPRKAVQARPTSDVTIAAQEFASAVHDRRAPRLVKTFRAHDDGVSSLAIDPTGQTLGTASDDAMFRTWQHDTELLLEGSGHVSWISSCVFHPADPTMAATGSGDKTVKLWDLSAARCKATLSGHAFAVWDVDFHCSGNYLASASLDDTVKLWDVPTQRCRRTLRGHTGAANSINFQSATNTAVSAGADRSCLLWDIRLGRAVAGLIGHHSAVTHATFCPDGGHIATVDTSGVLKLWEMRTHTEVATTKIPGAAPGNRCAFDPTGTVVAVGSEDSVIRLFSTESIAEGPLCELSAHTDAVQGLVFNRDAGSLISGSADGTVRTWLFE